MLHNQLQDRMQKRYETLTDKQKDIVEAYLDLHKEKPNPTDREVATLAGTSISYTTQKLSNPEFKEIVEAKLQLELSEPAEADGITDPGIAERPPVALETNRDGQDHVEISLSESEVKAVLEAREVPEVLVHRIIDALLDRAFTTD